MFVTKIFRNVNDLNSDAMYLDTCKLLVSFVIYLEQ